MQIDAEFKPGVYAIWCGGSRTTYVGSGNCRVRLVDHYRFFRKGVHSFQMQVDWDKYGESVFKFFILEYCDVSICQAREEAWIKAYDAAGYKLYNIARPAFQTPERKKAHSEATKRGMTSEVKAKLFTPRHRANLSAAMSGKVFTPEHKAKLGKHSRKQILLSNGMVFNSYNEFAKACGKSPVTISGEIIAGRTPDELAERYGLILKPIILSNGMQFSSQKEFAEACGVRYESISRQINNGRTPDELAKRYDLPEHAGGKKT